MFVRNFSVGTAKLSPDDRFVAHRLSKDNYQEEYIGLFDFEEKDTRPVVKMGFLDGFAWNLTGDKIIYQNTLSGKCEIRLLTFLDEDKKQFDDERIKFCPQESGQISFAWHSEDEYYANYVVEGALPTANNLPFHHLYSYNIKTNDTSPIIKAVYQGGIGFYSLEYDPSTERLYFLQTNLKTTDIYQYDGKIVKKIHTLDYYLPFYAVGNNKLVYKNKQQHFVVNSPADDFDNPKALSLKYPNPVTKPNIMGDKIVYLSGRTRGISLHQLNNNQLSEIDTQGFSPSVLASHNNQIIFAAKQSGKTQIYIVTNDNDVKKISDMKSDEAIRHLEVAQDIFVLSYDNRVDIYQLKNQQLAFIDTIKNYSYGTIHPNAKTLLLRQNNDQSKSIIIEKYLHNLQDTGRQVLDAKFAFYHHNDIVYLSHDKELIRQTADSKQIIANNIDAPTSKYIAVDNDDFYYFDWFDPNRTIYQLNLITGNKHQLPLTYLKLEQIQVINNQLVVGAVKILKPQLISGQLVTVE